MSTTPQTPTDKPSILPPLSLRPLLSRAPSSTAPTTSTLPPSPTAASTIPARPSTDILPTAAAPKLLSPSAKDKGKEVEAAEEEEGSYLPCVPSVNPKMEWGVGPAPGEKYCYSSAGADGSGGRRPKRGFWRKVFGR
ncbi:hypothetical protein L873DRAFT_1804734 [Choiromyces venosus 120613-1]|uniref:Uncharacterized protein n=1 Tax=Choiromyces venosus 120613-1 TaxID=1336337 RepID=A0A3N4JUZ0_9PEZI|nr:hypothetical protein L873DRAFT_1804734 [Choiromyces venosus 120613-1]